MNATSAACHNADDDDDGDEDEDGEAADMEGISLQGRTVGLRDTS